MPPKKHIAESKSYKYSKVDKTDITTTVEKATEEIFDLSTLNLKQFVTNLKIHIDKKPSSLLCLRKRNNKKIQLETEKIDLLADNVYRLVNLGREVANLQAEAVLSNQTIYALIESKQEEFVNMLEMQVKKHLLEADDVDHTITMKKLEAKAKAVDIEKILEEIATNRMVREEIGKLPPKEKAYVLGKMISKNKDEDNYFEIDHESKMQEEKYEQEKDKTDSLKVDKNFKVDKWEELKKQRGK